MQQPLDTRNNMLPTIFVCLVLKFAFLLPSSHATLTEKIIRTIEWDGVAAYLPVDRDIIRQKLDSWYESVSDDVCDGPRLYLPTNSVFPNILNETQHVLYIDAGHTHFFDFEDLPDKTDSMIAGFEFAVTIPLLTDDPDGIPHYSLALSKFYQRDRGDIAMGNMGYPYIPVDELFMNDTSVLVRNGSDEIRLSFETFTHPCKEADPVVRHEFDEFVERDYQIGSTDPHFSFCDRHPIDNNFCTTAQNIKCQVHRASPNFCQTSWKTPGRKSCVTPLSFVNVSKGFRDFMLLGEGDVKVIASESFYGNFSLGLKYPCIE